MVAMAGIAALMWLGAGLAAAQTSQNTPVFARIVVSEKSVVYIQIDGSELRAAMSVEGLKTAAPLKWSMESVKQFETGEFALPVPADQLPASVTAIKATLWTVLLRPSPGAEYAPHIYGPLTVSRTDDQKAVWQYLSRVCVLGGADAEKAPSIKLPSLDDAKAVLQAAPSRGKLAVGLRIMAGGVLLTDVRKDGQPVQVKMIVTDASGAEIASKVGPLSDFGFS
jgi:hypothetical protein